MSLNITVMPVASNKYLLGFDDGNTFSACVYLDYPSEEHFTQFCEEFMRKLSEVPAAMREAFGAIQSGEAGTIVPDGQPPVG